MRGTTMARTITVLAAVGAALAIGAAPVQSHEAPAAAGSEVVETQAAVRVTGILQRATEGGCFTLRTASAQYHLVGQINEFLVGQRVTVAGEFTQYTGPCVQGRTIAVESMVRA